MVPNKFYPLPADYDTLSIEGQRSARLSVLTDQSTPEKLVLAWDLFRRLYLRTVGEAFYKGGFQESPEFHYQAVRDLGTFSRNALGAPRGSAKSTVIGLEIPLLLALTRPHYEVMMGLSTDRLVEERFDKLMSQFAENPYIMRDFGVMQPKRGSAIWNHHHLHLNNGAVIKGISVMGRKRGGRPQLFILDDPENDPDSESQQAAQLVLEKFERILFRQVVPMLEHGSSIFWVGTLINRRSFLYHATCMDDPRFNYWNRRVLKALNVDEKDPSKTTALWAAKWPTEVLEMRRQEIGDSAFSAEYLNMPISDTEKVLTIDPRRNEYTVDGDFDRTHPLIHLNKTIWTERKYSEDKESPTVIYTEESKPFRDLVAPMFRIACFDYASGLNQYNDYSCLGIFGFDTNNTLWILDMWLGRAKDATLLRLIYEYCLSWRVKLIGIESASIQVSFKEAAEQYIHERINAKDNADAFGWKPNVFPIKYPPNVSKANRITGIEWRYKSGRIKYPAHLSHKWPFNQLYTQTADFTPDLALLVHDDAIDTVSMCQYVVHSRGMQIKRDTPLISRAERLLTGTPIVTGLPLLSGINANDLSTEELEILLDKKIKTMHNRDSRYITKRPKVFHSSSV